MSGHSKWSTIRRAKEITDQKRGKIFSKISKDITLAARLGGGGDLSMNPLLKSIVDQAKAANMPGDNIQKAINKGVGVNDGSEIIHNNTYEAYGPGGVAILIDSETDNSNRTLTEVRTIITKAGFKMVPGGSVSWQFDERGEIILKLKISNNVEDLMLELLDIDGIVDLKKLQDGSDIFIKIYTIRESLKQVHDEVINKFNDRVSLENIQLAKVPQTYMDLSDEDSQKLQNLLDQIEEQNDVTSIWTSESE